VCVNHYQLNHLNNIANLRHMNPYQTYRLDPVDNIRHSSAVGEEDRCTVCASVDISLVTEWRVGNLVIYRAIKHTMIKTPLPTKNTDTSTQHYKILKQPLQVDTIGTTPFI